MPSLLLTLHRRRTDQIGQFALIHQALRAVPGHKQPVQVSQKISHHRRCERYVYSYQTEPLCGLTRLWVKRENAHYEKRPWWAGLPALGSPDNSHLFRLITMCPRQFLKMLLPVEQAKETAVIPEQCDEGRPAT